MWLPILALIIGFCVVYLPQVDISPGAAQYLGVAIVAGFDSVVGAIHSHIEGKFSDRVFVTGFFTNTVLAALLLYVGERMQIQYVGLAIIVALFIRIFNNLGFIRRYAVARLFEKRMTSDKNFPEP